MQIGIMGALGSFSQSAAELYVQQQVPESEQAATELTPLISAEAVLTAVEVGDVDRGIFPIENSNGGIVLEAVYAMAAHRFGIELMFEFDVHHMLLVRPGVIASQIDTICSHDQALKQCRMYLRRIWPEADVLAYSDTATAAQALADGELPETTAVIAPARSASMYGLDILEESIQDLKFNYTTFVVATR